MFKKVLIYLSCVIILYACVCAFLPSYFFFERKVAVARSKEVPFAAVASFRNWQYWSPWSDTSIRITFRGPETHVGAEMQWESNVDGGGGSNKIVDFTPYSYIKIETFTKRIGKPIYMEFKFEETAPKNCEVRWIQSGNLSFFERPFGLLMEKAMSKDIEQGLLQLKAAAEANN
ncbi:MAG: SRPBCC family protein [Chitinophagales bacterium]